MPTVTFVKILSISTPFAWRKFLFVRISSCMQKPMWKLPRQLFLPQISKFLSPQVNFYELDEMLHRCKSGNLEIRRFEQNPAKIWLEIPEEEYPKIGSLISIVGSGNNVGSYSVTSIIPDKKSPNLAEIQVSPRFSKPYFAR